MIKFVALFLYMLGMLLLWTWWMGPDPVHFTGYDEPTEWKEMMIDDTSVLPM